MPPVLDWLLWIFARIFATIGKLPAILPNSQNEDGRSPSLHMAVGLLIWWKVGGKDRRQEDGLSGLAKAHRGPEFLGIEIKAPRPERTDRGS